MAIAHENRGVILTALGRFEEAAAAIEQALRLAPGRARSYLNLAAARRTMPDDPHLAAMHALLEAPSLSRGERADLHFALGKALEDIGDREGSFLHLLEANAEQRKLTPYDETATLARMRSLTAAFDADFLRRHAGEGDPSAKPVFIVGMPRSGTSLAEQILASHPKVFGAGELDDFELEAAKLAEGAGNGSLAADLAAFVEAGRMRTFGSAYLARLVEHAPEADKLIDKMPANFRYLGLIRLALPNARVIHMRRDPVDTCLSCFSKRFFGHVPWSYDLAELGRYYRAYEAMMSHWRTALPDGFMIEVRYEDLVADLEVQTRRMLAHIGLDWDPHCLDFHATERTVQTASAAQVRRPIYRTSIERWRPYEAWLGPLLAELRAPTAV
jgi:tetratricopeptide (TPR) repeat protein